MANYVRIAATTEVPIGQGRVFTAAGREIALFNIDGQFYAVNNVCPHRGGPLGEGDLAGSVVTCPWHGWSFDVASGAGVTNPAAHCELFPTKVEGDEVLVAL